MTDIQYKAMKERVDSFILISKRFRKLKQDGQSSRREKGGATPTAYPCCCIETYPNNVPQTPVQLVAYEAPSAKEILKEKPRGKLTCFEKFDCTKATFSICFGWNDPCVGFPQGL
jgi:hypothetical protein